MELQIIGKVDDPVLLAQELTTALGFEITLDIIEGDGRPQLQPPPGPIDMDLVRQVIEAHKGAERQQLDALVTKARAVWNGTDTFTVAQVQKILAGLVLLENRRR